MMNGEELRTLEEFEAGLVRKEKIGKYLGVLAYVVSFSTIIVGVIVVGSIMLNSLGILQ